MQKIVVQKANSENKKFIIDCQLALALESEDLKLDQETLTSGVEAVLEDPDKGEYYIAHCDGVPAGMLLTLPEWSDWRNGRVMWIHSVYTLPEFREKGIYKELYFYLKNKAEKDSHIAGLRLYVDKRNTSAMAVYKKLEMNNEHYELFEWLKGSS